MLRAARAASRRDPILAFSPTEAQRAARDPALGAQRHGRAPPARHARRPPLERRPFAIWQNARQVRADRSRRQLSITNERLERFRSLAVVVGAGAPSTPPRCSTSLAEPARACEARRRRGPRRRAALEPPARQWRRCPACRKSADESRDRAQAATLRATSRRQCASRPARRALDARAPDRAAIRDDVLGTSLTIALRIPRPPLTSGRERSASTSGRGPLHSDRCAMRSCHSPLERKRIAAARRPRMKKSSRDCAAAWSPCSTSAPPRSAASSPAPRATARCASSASASRWRAACAAADRRSRGGRARDPRRGRHEAEEMAGETRLREVIVNLTCGQPRSRHLNVRVAVGGRAVTDDDLRRVLRPRRAPAGRWPTSARSCTSLPLGFTDRRQPRHPRPARPVRRAARAPAAPRRLRLGALRNTLAAARALPSRHRRAGRRRRYAAGLATWSTTSASSAPRSSTWAAAPPAFASSSTASCCTPTAARRRRARHQRYRARPVDARRHAERMKTLYGSAISCARRRARDACRCRWSARRTRCQIAKVPRTHARRASSARGWRRPSSWCRTGSRAQRALAKPAGRPRRADRRRLPAGRRARTGAAHARRAGAIRLGRTRQARLGPTGPCRPRLRDCRWRWPPRDDRGRVAAAQTRTTPTSSCSRRTASAIWLRENF